MKKVLYISYNGMTDPLGQSQVLPYLVALANYGYQFTILSFEKKESYNKDRKIVDNILNNAGINWVPLFYTQKPPILSKIYDRWQIRTTALKLQHKFKFHVIHCRSYVSAEIGLILKKRYGVKFLFDMRGFWADEKVDNGQWNLKNPVYKRIYHHYKRKEAAFLLHADAIISLTETGKCELIKQKKYSQLFIDVIPCCADLHHFNFHLIDEETRVKVKNQLGIKPHQKVITYLGSIGGWYMTDEMFEFFKRVLIKDPRFVMLIITKDNDFRVKNEAALRDIPMDKIVVHSSNRNDLPAYLSVSDYSIFFIRPTYSKIASSPTKHAELMGMGIPVICNDIGDTGKIISETNTGKIVHDFTQTEYDRIVEEMPRLLAIDKQHIRDVAFKYFDLAQGVNKYRNIYQRLLT